MKLLYESILSSVGAGKTAVIKKIVSDKDFTLQNIALLEKSVSVWKPKDRAELIDVIKAYIKSAGPECSLNWIDVSDINRMFEVFSGSDFNGDISKWNTSKVTDMRYMFEHSIFNRDISEWNVRNVKYMNSMFEFSLFNGDISKWDVSNVKNVANMFKNSKFNSDISKWDISNAGDPRLMFYKCEIDDEYKPKAIVEL